MTRPVLLFGALLVIAGCATGNRIQPITIDQLRDYREAQLAERLLARLVVSVDEPRVEQLANDASGALRAELHARGENMALRSGARLVDHYPIEALTLYVYVLEAESARKAERAAARLADLPGVRDVQRVNLFRTRTLQVAPGTDATEADPDDPLSPLQPIPRADLIALHALATGRGVTVAVVDTGIDLRHEDFSGARLVARDLVDNAASVPVETHATAVTGVMLAQPGNGLGLRGIAPDAAVIVLRACWQQGAADTAYCNTFTLAKALSAALEAGVDVVNLSLTGPMDPLLVALVEELQANNVIVVAAYPDAPGQGPFPAELPGVIAVTSRTVRADDPGPIYAPGDDVITLLPGNRYGLRDGSSISAAQISGIASLFRERQPGITAEALDALLHGRGVEEEGLPGLVQALRDAGE